MFNDNYSKKKKAADILGINVDAKSIEIKKAYRNAALKWHPDKNTNNVEEANNKFKEISKAYKILIDDENNFSEDSVSNMDNSDIFSNLASKVFGDIIFSMGGYFQEPNINIKKNNNPITEEDEINLEAEELYDYLNFIEKQHYNRESCNFIPENIYVFGPHNIKPNHQNLQEKNNKVKETPEDLSLNFRVRINIDDIWKNTKKLLPVKNKYTINLPLYYSNITFNNSIKNVDNVLKNISVEIVDKHNDNSDTFFKRKGQWDLETIKNIPLNDLYKDIIIDIELPDKSIKQVEWKKEYISNIQNENIKGFFLYDLGLPIPTENDSKNIISSAISRGKLWVKISIILPNILTNAENEESEKSEEGEKSEVEGEESEKSEEGEKSEVEGEESEKSEVEGEKSEVDGEEGKEGESEEGKENNKKHLNKYVIPEWTSSKDWNSEDVKRNIILNLDDYL
jgi:DnaJ-class molecular chaperone